MPKIKVNCDNQNNNIVQNFILHDKTAKKVPGTNRYNSSPLLHPISWVNRYYGIQANREFIKKTLCFSDGKMYMGDDVLQNLTLIYSGMQTVCKPESLTVQVAGNSRMYFFDGFNVPIYYEGNDTGTFYKSSITYKIVQAVIKDGRMFSFERNKSTLVFSRALYPEDYDANYAGEIIVGNEKGSFIRRLIMIGNDVYILKNDSIWALSGSTKATYQVNLVVPNMGLLAQKAICMLGSAYVLVCQQDKEIYEFNGTPNLRLLSKDILGDTFSKKLDHNHTDDIELCNDTVNKLFRCAYNEVGCAEIYMNNELVFPTDEFQANDQPKWSESYGAAIGCYSVWDRQGDHTLVTGRSDLGYLMYHNRGHNWDQESMECIFRTDDIIPAPGNNCQFNSIFIRGTPSIGTFEIRTYLDSRNSEKTSQNMSITGEQRTFGQIKIATQASFHNWIPTLMGYDIGESISIEIYSRNKSQDLEIEDIIVDYTVREDIRSSLVGG